MSGPGPICAVVASVALLVACSIPSRLWGKSDETVPLAFGKRLAKALPRARLVELEAGHVPNQECPEEVLRHLARFLGSE